MDALRIWQIGCGGGPASVEAGIMPGAENSAVTHMLRAVELEIAASQRADGGNARKAKLSAGVLVGAVDFPGLDGAERREYRYVSRSWPPEFDPRPHSASPRG